MMFEGILILLKLVSLAARWVNERRHFTAGQKDQIVKTMVEISNAVGVARQVRQEIELMSDDELDEELMR